MTTPLQRKAWFAAKRYGYGSGLPLSWEGWVALAAYLAIILFAAYLLPIVPQLVLIAVATIVFGVICATRTQGGWRWRWGDKP